MGHFQGAPSRPVLGSVPGSGPVRFHRFRFGSVPVHVGFLVGSGSVGSRSVGSILRFAFRFGGSAESHVMFVTMGCSYLT